MSTVVHAPRSRVWRAVAEPAEMIRWDEHRIALEEPAPDYPQPDQIAHWRYRLGSVPVDRRDRATEVVPGSRLRLEIDFGSFRCEETYTLVDEDGDQKTRLSLRLVSNTNSVPLVSGALDRFDVRRLASELVDGSLRAVQKWCENHD
jgi:uncharacterized protein YndB with AHSA1/START domain